MLLDCQLAKSGKISAVPCQVRMRISEPRHESSAPALDYPRGRIIDVLVDVGDGPHSRDPFTYQKLDSIPKLPNQDATSLQSKHHLDTVPCRLNQESERL